MIEKIGDYKLINDAFPGIGAKLKLFWGHPGIQRLDGRAAGLQTGCAQRGISGRGFICPLDAG
jgi:hypothetical protein